MNPKLTDIPVELQSVILNKLCTEPFSSSQTFSRRSPHILEGASGDLPDDLLHVSQASMTLSKAVISTIGPHAKFLSFFRSVRLSEWIYLLRNHVKAVSFAGASLGGYCENGCEEVCNCEHFRDITMQALKLLCIDGVALEALDIVELALADPGEAEEIASDLIKAMQRSSCSLREISLHTNKASAMALPFVTLPNLESAKISTYIPDSDELIELSDTPNSSEVLCDILKGLSGHANRFANISTIRELELYGVEVPPILDRNSCSSLFSAVRKLTLSSVSMSNHSGIAEFTANFRNLRTIVWKTDSICAEDMNKIFLGCPEMDNLELLIGSRGILPGEIQLAQNSSELNDLFSSFHGKLSRLHLRTCLSSLQMMILGERNPNLNALEMEIDSTNVGAIGSLFGHCHKLYELRLNYSRAAIECLGRNGWPALSRSIRNASKELRVFSLKGERTGPIVESASFEMVKAIRDILEFMGDRASAIEFKVPIDTHNPFIVKEAICESLLTAMTECRSLRALCLDFIQDVSLGGYPVELEQEDDLIFCVQQINLLASRFKLRHGFEVDLGDVETLRLVPE